MNPAMMAQAQEMMKKMSPEDIRQMQEMASKMDPSMMQQMQQQMASNPSMMAQASQAINSMTPEQIRQQMAQASNLTPAQLQHQAQMAQMGGGGMAAATPPAIKGPVETLRESAAAVPPSVITYVEEAERLKGVGNKRFSAQDFDGAIAKYESALASLADSGYESELTSANLKAVHALADSVLVNTAVCHLKKSAAPKAAECCSKVLARSPNHRKALFNRGKALMAQGDLKAAVADLKGVHRQDRLDQTVLTVLKEAQAKLKAEGGDVGVGEVDTDDDDDMPALTPVQPQAGRMGPMGGAMGQMDPAMLANMDVDNLDPAMLAQMQQADPRMAGMSPEMIKASIQMAKSMSPEQLASMQKMASQMGMNPGGPGMGGMGSPGMGGMGGGGAGGMPDMSNAAAMMENISPEMMESMSSMMKQMDPAAMASMMSSASGRQISPDEAKKMQEQFSKVSPETMQLWIGRAARAYKMWQWVRAGAMQIYADPRRAMAGVATVAPMLQLTALLGASVAVLLVGQLTRLY